MFLKQIESSQRSSTILTEGKFIAIKGTSLGDIDYICGWCKRITLVESVQEGQIWDIDFLCPECGNVSRSPELPSGIPLPAGTVTLLKGDFKVQVTVTIPEEIVMAGTLAVERRRSESGWGSNPKNHSETPSVMSAKVLESLLIKTKQLFGQAYQDIFNPIESRKNQGGPVYKGGRITELIVSIERSIASFSDIQPRISVSDVIELNILAGLLERWQRDPAFERTINMFKSPSAYYHNFVLLLAVSHLTDLGNGIGLYGESTTPIADFWIQVSATRKMNVEVKAPLILSKVNSPLSKAMAQKAFDKAWKHTVSGNDAQLNPNEPGLLLIGGVALSPADLDQLEIIAKKRFLRNQHLHSHLAGVILLSYNLASENSLLWHLKPPSNAPKSMTGAIMIKIVQNPSYDGSIQISAD